MSNGLRAMRLGARKRGIQPAQIGGRPLRHFLDLRGRPHRAKRPVFQRSSSLLEPPGMLMRHEQAPSTVPTSRSRRIPHPTDAWGRTPAPVKSRACRGRPASCPVPGRTSGAPAPGSRPDVPRRRRRIRRRSFSRHRLPWLSGSRSTRCHRVCTPADPGIHSTNREWSGCRPWCSSRSPNACRP